MKITQSIYILLALILLGGCYNSTVQNKSDSKVLSFNQKDIQGQEAYPIDSPNVNGWLVVDEGEGLTWLDSDFTPISQWSGKVATIDWRISLQQPHMLLIAALDDSTSATHLLHFDLAQASFNKLASLPANESDIAGGGPDPACAGPHGAGHAGAHVVRQRRAQGAVQSQASVQGADGDHASRAYHRLRHEPAAGALR